MNVTDPSLELKGLVPPEPLLPQPFMPVWGWFALAGGIMLVAVLVVIFARLFRREAKTVPPELRNRAYQDALAALTAAPLDRVQEVATIVSSALRRYLARVSGDPALYETHEEFISRHEVLTKYPEELRTVTSATFTELAKLKYGKNASGDAEVLVARARNLLDKLHTVPAA